MQQEQKVDGPADQYNVQKLSRTLNYFPSVLYSCPLLCTSWIARVSVEEKGP